MPNIRLIAGRGKLGDTNWGTDLSQPPEERQKWLIELLEHVSEVVMLTGGGSSMGEYWLGLLVKAELAKCGDKYAIKVWLEHLTPRMSDPDGKFDPWIDSWQISVIERS